MRASIKAQMSEAIARGTPVLAPGWVQTAERAREDGFTPVLYHSLFEALWKINAHSFRSHPSHRRIEYPQHIPGTPFEPELWQGWPHLVVSDGFDPGTATELVLLFAESS